MNRKILPLLAGLLLVVVGGCAKWQGALGIDANLRHAVSLSVDELLVNARTPLPPQTTFLVASLVNIDSLRQSSTFGRTLAEYATARLVGHGLTTSEIKLRQTLFFEEESGEFLLSRNINEISAKYAAQVIVVGTYSIGRYVVYVSLRLVEADSSTILATAEFEVPLGAEVNSLLRNDRVH